MPSIRFRRAGAVLVICAVIVGGHLLPGLNNSLVEDGVRNGLHMLVFAALAVFLTGYLVSSGFGRTMASVTAVLAVAIIGALSESLQYVMGRQPDVLDVVRDVSGAVLALAGLALWRWSGSAARTRMAGMAARAASSACGLLIVAPLLFWSSIIGMGRLSAPVILDFDQWWNRYIYRPVNASISPTDGADRSAEIFLLKWSHSGIVISPMMTNWSGYEFIEFSAYLSKGSAANVTVRINDSKRRNSWSDQFIVSVVIAPGTSTIRIPLGDLLNEPGQPSMDLSDIQELVILAREPESDTVMMMDDIRLE